MTQQDPGTDAAIFAHGLTKSYGERPAVNGVDLAVRRGEIFGFLGPNGAGKSTTLKMLCTLLRPSGGLARVAGFDVSAQSDQVRRSIGVVFQETTLDAFLTAQQNLRFHAELYGVPRTEVEDRIQRVLETVGLADRRAGRVMMFSGGMKRRLEIARAFLHTPRVLFLDEPTVGLDPQTRASIWSHIRSLKESYGVTVFMTTHYMDEAEHCDRIAIIDQGVIQTVGSPAALKASVGKDRVQISSARAEELVKALSSEYGVEAEAKGESVTFSVEDGEQFVPRMCGSIALPISSVSVSKPSLDDVFMSFTGRSIRDGEQADRFGWMRQAMLSGGR